MLNRTFMICASLVVAVSIWSGTALPATADIRFDARLVRMAYDTLKRTHPQRANKEYLGILYLAARENEQAVDRILESCLDQEVPLSATVVKQMLAAGQSPPRTTEIHISGVELASYDALLSAGEVAV